jgi:hypothetical protein
MPRLALSALLAIAVSGPVVAASGLPFIEDDYARALGEARSRQLPLFVESWAPW